MQRFYTSDGQPLIVGAVTRDHTGRTAIAVPRQRNHRSSGRAAGGLLRAAPVNSVVERVTSRRTVRDDADDEMTILPILDDADFDDLRAEEERLSMEAERLELQNELQDRVERARRRNQELKYGSGGSGVEYVSNRGVAPSPQVRGYDPTGSSLGKLEEDTFNLELTDVPIGADRDLTQRCYYWTLPYRITAVAGGASFKLKGVKNDLRPFKQHSALNGGLLLSSFLDTNDERRFLLDWCPPQSELIFTANNISGLATADLTLAVEVLIYYGENPAHARADIQKRLDWIFAR